MQLGVLAIVISTIAVIYGIMIAYLITRAIFRSVVDAPPKPIRVNIVVEEWKTKEKAT